MYTFSPNPSQVKCEPHNCKDWELVSGTGVKQNNNLFVQK